MPKESRSPHIILRSTVFCVIVYLAPYSGLNVFSPAPSDLSRCNFKQRSTPSGTLPKDDDLLRTLYVGLPGSAMPSFGDVLSVPVLRALVVEDGPTLTHGGMAYGAGWFAARQSGAAEIVDARPYAVGTLRATYDKYPNAARILPAMGYGDEQVRDLEATINKVDCDAVAVATPIDLSRVIDIRKPSTRVYYDLQEIGSPNLDEILSEFGKVHNLPTK